MRIRDMRGSLKVGDDQHCSRTEPYLRVSGQPDTGPVQGFREIEALFP